MKTILLVGSSIFQAWGNYKDIAPNHSVVNRAIGGTITSYWKEYLPDVLSVESPDNILFYCGSNDVGANIPEEEIFANFLQCRKIIHEIIPVTAFAYFSIIKAPEKKGKWNIIDRLNSAVKERLYAGDLYVETNKIFFRDGAPVSQYFVEDNLHLNDEAYDALLKYSQPLISEWI